METAIMNMNTLPSKRLEQRIHLPIMTAQQATARDVAPKKGHGVRSGGRTQDWDRRTAVAHWPPRELTKSRRSRELIPTSGALALHHLLTYDYSAPLHSPVNSDVRLFQVVLQVR